MRRRWRRCSKACGAGVWGVRGCEGAGAATPLGPPLRAPARYHLHRARVDLEVQVEPDLPLVEAEPGQLQHIFLNMVLWAAEQLEAAGGGTLAVQGGAGPGGMLE